MARITVFGAGAMGTALAMHLARLGNETVLWGSRFDERVLPSLRGERRHPVLPERLPESLQVLGPEDLEDAARGIEVAVMGAHSGGARSLAQMTLETVGPGPTIVALAKGLEPGTGRRMSELFAEEAGHDRVVSVGGPCLASELANGLPSAVVFAAPRAEVAEGLRSSFESKEYRIAVTDDLAGLEYCTVLKNVAAIGLGILDGLGKVPGLEYRNAKAALFAQAVAEQVRLVEGLGGRAETVTGLAGLGDTLVTALGGRNRLYGELLGEGAEPREALEGMVRRGMTVEGVDSARDVHELVRRAGARAPFHETVYRIVFEGADPQSVLRCLE